MPSSKASAPILEGEPTAWAQALWEQLHPDRWPLSAEELPPGTVLVGGAVRDGLIGRLQKRPDLDLMVPGKAIELTGNLARTLGGTCVVLDTKRDIARLVLKGWTIDIAAQEGSNLEEDLWRRDFRLNAIALTLEAIPRLVDPTGGLNDLQQKKLVAIREQNLLDDPLRLLRGLRLMAELQLTPEAKTWSLIHCHHKLLPQAAPERIQAELQRLVNAHWADEVLPLLLSTGLLNSWQNSIEGINRKPPSHKAAKALNTAEQALALPLARLTYLVSDEGLIQLRFSRKQRQRCQLLRHWQNRNDGISFESLSEIDRLQLHLDLEKDLPALILQLPQASQLQWLERWRDPDDPLFHPYPPVDGYFLQKSLNLPMGRTLGDLLRHLCQERAFGRLHNQEQVLNEAIHWWEQNKPCCD
ncbi:MAG: CCA tRNA nucleotidyltransferase [Prochlorococcus sp.]